MSFNAVIWKRACVHTYYGTVPGLWSSVIYNYSVECAVLTVCFVIQLLQPIITNAYAHHTDTATDRCTSRHNLSMYSL